VSSEIDKSYKHCREPYNSQKYAEAEAGLKAVIDQNPDKTEAYYYLGATISRPRNTILPSSTSPKPLIKIPPISSTSKRLSRSMT
jgi:hypothetical protein